MRNIVVYNTYFPVSEGNNDKLELRCGGFWNYKRFLIVLNPYMKEDNIFDNENQIYKIKKMENAKLLPIEMRQALNRNGISNRYIPSRSIKAKEKAFEALMLLIENGYEIENIEPEYYSELKAKYDEHYRSDPFIFKYKEKETGKLLLKINMDYSYETHFNKK